MPIRLNRPKRATSLQEITRALPSADEATPSAENAGDAPAEDNLPPRLLSLRETAEWLCVSLSTVKRLVARNELFTVRVGARRKVPANHLEAYIGRDILIPSEPPELP